MAAEGPFLRQANMNRQRSHEAFQRARQVIPGGVNSPARAFGAVGGEPIFIGRAEGPYLYDLDGNRYTDYVASWGPMILGHAHPEVISAVCEAAQRGTSYGAPTEGETELAHRVRRAMPAVEMLRLVNSGTEAVMSALRLARGYTGRETVVKFAGNYHGHVDSLLVAAGSSAATLGVPNSPGVTAGTAQDTLVLPYNDADALETAFSRHGDRIAAVIFEPVAGNMGCVLPQREFLQALRSLTRRHGALLICDEMITGFRIALGGAQQRLEIEPDLVTLGKILGGGLPVGAYGGRSEIMRHMLPEGKVFQAGTLSGNPLAVAAGNATLRLLEEQNPYPRLETLSQRLADGLARAAAEAGIPHWLPRIGSMMTLFFNAEPVVNWDGAARCDTRQFARFFWGLIDRGVYFPCSQYEALFVSAAHSEADIDQTIEAARAALAELAAT